MRGNVAWALAERAALYGWRDRPLFHAGDATYTHGQVHDAAARAAAALLDAGVRPGRRALIALPDSIGFATAFLGTLRLGAVAVPVDPEQAPEQHARVLSDAEPAAVVCDDAGLARRLGASHAQGAGAVLTPADLSAGPAYVPDPEPLPPGAPAYVLYTSGATGPPKGVVHRHTDPETHFYAMALGALGMAADDVMLSLAKACTPYGLGNTIFFPMFCGAAAVLWPDRPTVRGVVRQTRRHRPTVMFAVPAFYAALAVALGAGASDADRSALSSLRAAASATEPLSPALAGRAEAVLGCPLLDGLGTAEVGHVFVSNTVTRRRRGTLGMVLDPYEISVRAEHGGEAVVGERGVLHVRGPSVSVDRPGAPELASADADGWLRTGDLVHVDADGFVHHHGRVEDLVAVGDELVPPLEIERVLGDHSAVSEVAVAGHAGREGGLRAYVVLAAGPPSAELEAELLGLARARLPSSSVPRSVRFVPALPRTPAGRLHRAALHRLPGADS